MQRPTAPTGPSASTDAAAPTSARGPLGTGPRPTACILCSINCGLEVTTGGADGRHIVKVRGDDAHPISQGYACEKPRRLDHYQNGPDRLRSPMRRRADGTYEAVSWQTAISEVAARLLAVKARHGGRSILYYGGGGQGNHLGGTYTDALLKHLGVLYRSNALAQEKTGEFWVQGKMFGTGCHGDFEHAEVAVFIGKNPWQSHGFARARAVLKEIERDPERALVVIDPRRSETAAMADYHLAVRPGTDAWCLAAMAAVVVQEGLVDRRFVEAHTEGFAPVERALRAVDVPTMARVCGVEESLLRAATRRIATAKSAAVLEDLGMQMNLHSTLGSYLQRLVWVLAGHYGRPGTQQAYVPFLSLAKASKGETSSGARSGPRVERRTPVTGSKIIVGLVPCAVIPDEILTDHPDRFRAMIIDSGNPAHSLPDSQQMRAAIRALEFSVVVDVAMTETARVADYVLPAASQYEKAEATFFTLEAPRNAFHVRHPLFEPLPGTLEEGEIHARLLEAMGAMPERAMRVLGAALRLGRMPFTLAFGALQARDRQLRDLAPVVLYRVLGPTLPAGLRQASSVWGLSLLHVLGNPASAARAGFSGPLPIAANALFDAILGSPSGVVFAVGEAGDSFAAITHPGHRIQLHLPELLPQLEVLAHTVPPRDPEFPLVLAAGERRTDTSNTAIRDASWAVKGRYGTLRMHPADAEALGLADGASARLETRRGAAEVEVELTDAMPRGSVSLPNGQGLDTIDADGRRVRRGVAPNELTDHRARDPIAGTPHHKYVPARVLPRIPA